MHAEISDPPTIETTDLPPTGLTGKTLVVPPPNNAEADRALPAAPDAESPQPPVVLEVRPSMPPDPASRTLATQPLVRPSTRKWQVEVLLVALGIGLTFAFICIVLGTPAPGKPRRPTVTTSKTAIASPAGTPQVFPASQAIPVASPGHAAAPIASPQPAVASPAPDPQPSGADTGILDAGTRGFTAAVPIDDTVAPLPSELAGKVVRQPITPEAACPIRVAQGSITTVSFLQPILAIDGAGFSDNPEQAAVGHARFLLAHRPNTNYFTVRALAEHAQGNLTVQVGQSVYTLFCREGTDAPWHITLEDRGAGQPGQNPPGTHTAGELIPSLPAAPDEGPAPFVSGDMLNDLLTRFRDIAEGRNTPASLHDSNGHPLQMAESEAATTRDGVVTRIVKVARVDNLDTLLFAIEITNLTKSTYYYDPHGFSIQADGGSFLPQSESFASGILNPGQTQNVYIALTGSHDGRRNNIPITAAFSLMTQTIRFSSETGPNNPSTALPDLPTGPPSPVAPATPSRHPTPTTTHAKSSVARVTSSAPTPKPSPAPKVSVWPWAKGSPSSKPSPTPKPKASPTPKATPTPKPTPKSTPKPTPKPS